VSLVHVEASHWLQWNILFMKIFVVVSVIFGLEECPFLRVWVLTNLACLNLIFIHHFKGNFCWTCQRKLGFHVSPSFHHILSNFKHWSLHSYSSITTTEASQPNGCKVVLIIPF
jgi:hypothetical protein